MIKRKYNRQQLKLILASILLGLLLFPYNFKVTDKFIVCSTQLFAGFHIPLS